MPQADTPTPVAPAHPKPLTVLIADNDADMRRYIRRSLRLLGSRVGRVLEAEDGTDALTQMQHEAIDVLITDIVMPRMSGLALCDALVADAALRSIPVLIVTGEVAQGRIRNHLGNRLHWDQLTKPFNATVLSERVLLLLADMPPT